MAKVPEDRGEGVCGVRAQAQTAGPFARLESDGPERSGLAEGKGGRGVVLEASVVHDPFPSGGFLPRRVSAGIHDGECALSGAAARRGLVVSKTELESEKVGPRDGQ